MPARGISGSGRDLIRLNPARRRSLGALVLALIGLLVVAGCSGGSLGSETVTSTVGATGGTGSGTSDGTGDASAGASSVAPSTTVVPPVASVAATPAFGTASLSPIEPLTFTIAKGTIDTVQMTNPDGKVVAQTISPDK